MWHGCGILHRDISPGNILVARDDTGVYRGYLIDFDHAVKVDKTTGEPVVSTASSRHRSGTTPFMALDRLSRPEISSKYLPRWHLPRYDIESFIWVFCWTLHHFGGKHASRDERKWRTCEAIDMAFSHSSEFLTRSTKLQWATTKRMRTSMDPSFEPLKQVMDNLLQPVIRGYGEAAKFVSCVESNELAAGLTTGWFHTLGNRLIYSRILGIIQGALDTFPLSNEIE